jgi:hypothetical protein
MVGLVLIVACTGGRQLSVSVPDQDTVITQAGYEEFARYTGGFVYPDSTMQQLRRIAGALQLRFRSVDRPRNTTACCRVPATIYT